MEARSAFAAGQNFCDATPHQVRNPLATADPAGPAAEPATSDGLGPGLVPSNADAIHANCWRVNRSPAHDFDAPQPENQPSALAAESHRPRFPPMSSKTERGARVRPFA